MRHCASCDVWTGKVGRAKIDPLQTGQCRRRAPVPQWARCPGDDCWPVTKARDGCGEHVEKPERLREFSGDPADRGQRILFALNVAERFAAVDDADGKAWLIDQMVRALTGTAYDAWVSHYETLRSGADNAWPEGLAPAP